MSFVVSRGAAPTVSSRRGAGRSSERSATDSRGFDGAGRSDAEVSEPLPRALSWDFAAPMTLSLISLPLAAAAHEGVDDRAGMCGRRCEKNACGGDAEGSHFGHPRVRVERWGESNRVA